ncbi:SMP-30/gluconolactonase/LRE family protein [Streptomyces sp. SAJ15]|uniref:SMP-30/gluconolactonase/LRE family protein n=1 Tax=Streptomyces sp. SAJ15 TaxID=2011095 RepID=UPI001186BC3E|nr:SMP-30/gluconolactonase/LRE family protein [Streptomyces sp. SAJ15]
MTRRRRAAATAVGLLSVLLAGGAHAPVAASEARSSNPSATTEPRPCAERASVEVFRKGGVPLLDWRENLEFDGRGTLWVSHITRHRVEGYAPDGTLRASFPVNGPGGLRRGPDGMMYVNYGVNPLTSGLGAGIMRFDPTSARPEPVRVVTGLSGINGLAIDVDGNFYLSRELSTGVLKIRPDGTKDERWTRAANVFGANGLEIVGDDLYASVITSTASPVVRIPLNDPAAHTTVTELSPNPLDAKLLDDLAHVDGDLVVASFRDGELIRVDPATGRSCVLVSGLRMPSSVRVPLGFGDHEPRRELFVAEASGRIVKVTIHSGGAAR